MSVVDDLLATVAAPDRAALEHIRAVIHRTVPAAEEVMTYGMAGFKYRNKYLVAFAAFKDHLSLFPGAIPDDVDPRLAAFKTSKGTLQFTVDTPIPDELIIELLRTRIEAIDNE